MLPTNLLVCFNMYFTVQQTKAQFVPPFHWKKVIKVLKLLIFGHLKKANLKMGALKMVSACKQNQKGVMSY